MTGPAKFSRVLKRIDQCLYSFGPVMCRDTCSAAMSQQVNRYGKSCFMKSRIIAHHQLQAQFIAMLFGQGYTDQAPAMFTHKIDYFRGNGGSGSNKISFIFTVLIIHYYYYFTFFNILNRRLNSVKHAVLFLAKVGTNKHP